MKWYTMKALSGQKAALYIYGDIVSEKWFDEEVSADSFRSDLAALGNVQEIEMHINSPGGNVFAGVAIYSLLRQHPARITAHVDGVAASIASVIMCAADKVLISEAGMVMIHNPWGLSIGDSREHRKSAEMQDQVKSAMIAAYQTRVAMTEEELAAAMDEEVWYVASQAVELGWADALYPQPAMVASVDLSIFQHPPKGINEPSPENPTMTTKKDEPVTSDGNQGDGINVVAIESAARKAALKADKERRDGIRAIARPFEQQEKIRSMLDGLLDDPDVSVDDASKRLLAKLGEGCEPAGKPVRVETGEDEREKFRRAAGQAVLARMQRTASDGGNEFRHASFRKLAARALVLAGAKASDVDALRPLDLITAALGGKVNAALSPHTTSDFPILLQDIMHKQIVSNYNAFGDVWRSFCKQAEVSDFRQHSRLKLGSFNNLTTVNEAGEYASGTIPDAEREYQQATTKGREIRLSRQLLVNDDLQAFSDLGTSMGRAAARTVESDVFALIASNPTMSDSTAFFHADHSNLAGSGAAVSSATLAAAEDAMRSQTDVGGNEIIDLRPRAFVGGLAAARTASEVMGSEFTPETTGSRATRRVNALFGMIPNENIVGTPRITGVEWYLFADPMEAPAFEVAFLDGESTPFIDSMETLNPDGVRMLVRLDYGVAAIDWRGAYKNAGT